MKFRYRRDLARIGSAFRSADPGGSSGDTVGFFENGRDYFYALLSDGMGCGPTAALTSGVATLFLEKMLGAGNSKTTTLKLLNNLLRNCGEENAATVDLLEFDLLTGCATFIKSGAAPSYVKRGGSLFRIRSRTVPVGMMATLDAEKIRFDASPGDVIVMLSDGVSQTPEDAPWLIELLSENWEGDLRDVAQRIVAVASRTREHPDDLSVALIRILPAEDGEIPEDATPAETPAVVAAEVPESVGEVAPSLSAVAASSPSVAVIVPESVGAEEPSLSAVGAAATAMAATVEAAETLFGGRGERLLSEADADENEKAPEDEPPENGGEPSAGESEAPPDGDEENRVAVIPSVSTEPDGEKEAS